MIEPQAPAERETPAGEAMREAVARFIAEGLPIASAAQMADHFLSPPSPIASELARLTALISSSEAERDQKCSALLERAEKAEAERDEARAERDAGECSGQRCASVKERERKHLQHVERLQDVIRAGDAAAAADRIAAEAALTSLRAEHAAEVARKDAEITRLKAQTPFVVTNGERGDDERFRMWSGRAWVWVKPVGYAALFVRKRDANQILPDGDPYDYPDRIRALTLKEAGHE